MQEAASHADPRTTMRYDRARVSLDRHATYIVAAYLTWHLRQALAELTYTDQDIPPASDPVAPAQRSAKAKAKDASKSNGDGLPVRKYQDLLDHLSTLDRQSVTFAGQRIEKLTKPTPVQRRAFELLGSPIPLTLQ